MNILQIKVNNQTKEIDSTSVNELLKELDIAANGIAIALNHIILPRASWNKQLNENDEVTIIRATRGG